MNLALEKQHRYTVAGQWLESYEHKAPHKPQEHVLCFHGQPVQETKGRQAEGSRQNSHVCVLQWRVAAKIVTRRSTRARLEVLVRPPARARRSYFQTERALTVLGCSAGPQILRKPAC